MVDLSDYVDVLKGQVNPPGTDLFPDAQEDDWVIRLVGAFWNARIQGITSLDPWTCDEEGIVTPQSTGGVDIPRDLIQLVVVWAAFKAVENQLRDLNSVLSVKAGPIEFEQQKSAQTMAGLLQSLKDEKVLILRRLSDVGTVPTYVFDRITALDASIVSGLGGNWITG